MSAWSDRLLPFMIQAKHYKQTPVAGVYSVGYAQTRGSNYFSFQTVFELDLRRSKRPLLALRLRCRRALKPAELHRSVFAPAISDGETPLAECAIASSRTSSRNSGTVRSWVGALFFVEGRLGDRIVGIPYERRNTLRFRAQ